MFVCVAGNSIDAYDRQNLELLRTVSFDLDMIEVVVVPQDPAELTAPKSTCRKPTNHRDQP